ncbi:MAG: recombinase RecA [Thermoplasmata archaeon]|nr:recombinase RecA [Thermoplasmata archaeon]
MGHTVLKVPTGVADFDSIINGGLPEGSVVMLIGDVGAGQQEFVYTSAFKLSTVKEHPYLGESMLGSFCNFEGLPEHICYVTFSRSKMDILREISEGFDSSFYNMLSRKLKFKDLSAHYYKKSLVPPSWTGEGNGGELFASTPKETVLEALIQYLDEAPANSMIIVDSLTDLVVSENIKITDLVNILRGLQRASKNWGGVIYLMLTQGILDKRDEQMLIDSVDGVLVFEWTKYLKSHKRQRYMYVEKFMSVLPHLDKERIARFPTMVTSQSGMTIINMETIS